MTISSDRIRLSAWLAAAFAALILLAANVSPAMAQSLDELRSQGVVGERYDGLLVLRDGGASAAVRSFVEETNAKRLAIYQQRATEQNVPVVEVGKVYAQQIMGKAPGGTYFQDAAGNWSRK